MTGQERRDVTGHSRGERIAAALAWISGRLRELGVPFQAAGGLAAVAHGATRPLNDIDLYVAPGELDRIREELAEHHAHGPRRFRSDRWDCRFLELHYAGEEIELADPSRTRYRRGPEHPWHDADVDFGASEVREVFGVELPVMPADRLVAYKRTLGRPVDREDVEQLTGAG